MKSKTTLAVLGFFMTLAVTPTWAQREKPAPKLDRTSPLIAQPDYPPAAKCSMPATDRLANQGLRLTKVKKALSN